MGGTPSCPQTWHHLHSVARCLHSLISDFRPPSVAESGEAALRGLLGGRAIGGYSLTSDDPAPGSLTVFQPSRVARPQDASKALHLVSLLSCSARSYLDTFQQPMLRDVSEVADMKVRLGPASRCVDLVEGGSIRIVETAVGHVGVFFVAKKAGAQRFIIDARASNRHFFKTSLHLDRCLQATDFVMWNSRERLRTLRTGL